MIKSALDLPSNAIRTVAGTAWSALPTALTQPLENFINNRSYMTRTLVKGAGTLAITGGATFFAGTIGAPTTAAFACGAAIGGRATRIHNVRTGQNLPREPKAPLLETAHKIALFESRSSKTIPGAAIEPNAIAPADKAAQMLATDQALKTFIQNASIATTITVVHTACLGLSIDPSIMPKIIREASEPNANLWDVYMKHLGHDLSTCQWIRACFWFFLTYSIGIVPNSMNTFLTNVLTEGRRNFSDPSQLAPLDHGLRRILDQISSFLDVYNGATRAYANAAEPKGDVDSYRRKAIAEFTGKTLETLTKEFCTTAVDEFFPHIPFFATLKQYRLIGWVFTLLDYLVGGIINCVGRKVLKWQLPSIAQSLIETGIDSTNPTNLPFSIAITNALTQLFVQIENTPPAVAETPILQPEKLPAVVEKLLDTLELNGTKEAPLDTQQKLKAQLKKMEDGIFRNMDRNITRGTRGAIVESCHSFLTHLTKNTEQVFGSVFTMLNSSFVEPTVQTPEDLTRALETLDLAAAGACNQLIQNYFLGVPIERQKEFAEQLYTEYSAKIDATLEQLSTAQERMRDASTTDQQMHGLEEYAQTVKTLLRSKSTDQAHLAGKAVQNAFYEAFHPFHKELPDLADQLLQLQALIQQRQTNDTFEDHLEQIRATLHSLSQNPEQRFASTLPSAILGSLSHMDPAITRANKAKFAQIRTQVAHLAELVEALENGRHIKRRLLEQKTAAERYTVPPWLTRAPSFAKVVKGPPLAEVTHHLAVNEQEHEANIRQLQAAIAHLNTEIAPLIQTQQPVTARNQEQLRAHIHQLQQKTLRMQEIHAAVEPAHIEKNPLIIRLGSKGIAKIGTPRGVELFKKAYHFLTMPAPYDASRRILMQTFVDAYKPTK